MEIEMNLRAASIGVLVWASSCALFAQTTPPAAEAAKPSAEAVKPAARETPPDQKAYTEAMRITDPAKKIEALEKFKTDFPSSSYRQVVGTAILSTLVTKLPEQQDRIRNLAREIYRKADRKNRGSTAATIADQLLNGGVLIKEARDYANQALKSMLLATYMQDQIAGYERRKQKPPAGEELQKRFRESRASRLTTLGRIEMKLGHAAKGKQLLEEAYAATPANPALLSALGEIAAKEGEDSKALQYLIPARLSGRAPKPAIQALEGVYRKTHNGSLEGLDAMLDAEYRKLYPNPLHVEPYKPTEKRSDRMVLAEVFTGAGCPPCVAADLAFDGAMERYSRKDLAVIMYHVHVPRPDPMTTAQTQALYKAYEITGVPTFLIDGKKTIGGGAREATKQVFEKFQKDLEKELEEPAGARLKADAAIAGNSVKVKASVDQIKSESNDLKLEIALVEKELRYSGENGVRFHPMVVRAMAGEGGGGFALTRTSGEFENTFDVARISKTIQDHLDEYESKGHRGESFTFSEKKYQIDRGSLAVVAFVHDAKTRQVLQAAYVDLAASGTPAVTESAASR
jgi:thiol-disulfide isomerase/thioredoxin